MLNVILPILFFASLSGFLYIIFKKLPALANIPIESIEVRETFFDFSKRVLRSFFEYFQLRKLKIHALVLADKILARFRATTLQIHKTIDVLSKDVKQRSQEEKWAHHWFMHKDKKEDKKQ